MGEVIEIDDGTKCDGLLKLLVWGIVRCEQNLLPGDPCRRCEKQLGDAAAVCPRSLLVEYLQNAWIRQGLDSKVLTEFGRPLEGVAQAAVILAYFAFIVKVKGGWKAFYERSGLRLI